MAQKIFLKMDQVNGESRIPHHEKQIDVLNWNWSMGSVGSATPTGGGRTATRPVALPFTFSHYIDTASPQLMKLCLQGVHIREAILSVCSEGRAELVEYFKLTLEDVIITSVILSANDDSSRTIESVYLLYSKAKEDYIQLKPDGTPGQTITTSFDFLRG